MAKMIHNQLLSKAGEVAIEVPRFERIESEVNKSGLAINISRHSVKTYKLVMDFRRSSDKECFKGGRDSAILAAESALQPWAKKVYKIGDQEFVLVPENQVLGFQRSYGSYASEDEAVPESLG